MSMDCIDIQDAPLFVTPEDFQSLIESVVFAANAEPYVRLIDPFVEMVDCGWCHRRIGEKNLVRGMCPYCLLSLRGAIVIAGRVCSESKGVD
jgi:hypothetical protein